MAGLGQNLHRFDCRPPQTLHRMHRLAQPHDVRLGRGSGRPRSRLTNNGQQRCDEIIDELVFRNPHALGAATRVNVRMSELHDGHRLRLTFREQRRASFGVTGICSKHHRAGWQSLECWRRSGEGGFVPLWLQNPRKKIAFSIAGGKSAGQRAKALEYAEEYARIHWTSAFAETGEASFNVTMYR